MKKHIFPFMVVAILLSACQTAPKPTTVDDTPSKRVPVNTTPIIF